MGIAKIWRELSKNEKMLLGIVIVLSVSVIHWIFILEPAIKKLKPLETEIKALKEEAKLADNIDSNIVSKEKALEELKTEYEEATKVISKTDRYPQLIKEIRENATKNSLIITSETLGVPTANVEQAVAEPSEEGTTEVGANPALGLKTMLISLNLEGDFNNVLDFVNNLEEDKRILEVKGFTSQDKIATVTLMYYIAGGEEEEEYDFNTGAYGKDNLFN